jgi:hypothetical protein
VHTAIYVGKSEIQSLKGKQSLSLVGTQPEVPREEGFIMNHGLMHELREGDEIEPSLPRVLAHELLLSGFGQWETQLIPADTLWLQLKACCTREVYGSDPQLVSTFVGTAYLGWPIVVDDRCAGFSALC